MNDLKSNTAFHKILLFSLGFLLYSNTLFHDYVLDDVLFITGNKYTQKGIAGIPDIVTQDALIGAYGEALSLSGGRYRPLSIAIFAIEYQFFGLNPFIGHFVNALLFGLTCLCLYMLISVLSAGINSWIPLAASLLFAVHPIHTEVVANIKSRDEILSLLFLILALMQILKGSMKNRIIGSFLFFLALLSKENAITGLAIIPASVFFFRSKDFKVIANRTFPFLLVALIYILLRSAFAGTLGDRETKDILDNPFVFATSSERLATVVLIAGKYLSLLFWPYPLSYDYSYNEIPLTHWTDWRVLLTLLLFSGAAYILMRATRSTFREKRDQERIPVTPAKPRIIPSKQGKGRSVSITPPPRVPARSDSVILLSIAGFGILFYFASYSIVSNLFFNIGTNLGERFAYMPSAGFCTALASGCALLFKIPLKSEWHVELKWLLPLIIILASASGWTLKRNKVWSGNYTLYENDVKAAPNSSRTHLYYGVELMGRYGKEKKNEYIEQAVSEMKKSIAICPAFHHAHYDLGLAYQMIDQHDSAIASFNRVLALQPLHIKSHYCLGVSYGKGKDDLDKAIFYLEKAMSFDYKEVETYDNLGIAYAMKGNLKKAVEVFSEGIKKYPDGAKLYFNLAAAWANNGEKNKADVAFKKAYELDPSLKPNN